MDALEFIRERDRMCGAHPKCGGCEAYNKENYSCCVELKSCEEPEVQISIVEQWSKDHPRKTRQSEFLKMFPEAIIGDDGALDLCPLGLCMVLE